LIKQLQRIVLVFVALAVFVPPIRAQAGETEILWDTWGVPHIFAPDNESLFYAFGFAQAHAHGDLILTLYGEARGRAAEYWGADFIESDTKWRTLRVPQRAQEAYEGMSPEYRAYIDAFARGITDYATENPEAVEDSREVVLPITGQDVIAHGIRVMRYEFVARQSFGVARRWQNGELPGQEQELEPTPSATDGGSNGWAIAPSRSASGNAMLIANPHQPWSGFGLWVEAHLVTPDMNLSGAALVGNPTIGVGFNDDLGWTHTVNTRDGWDLYRLVLTETGYVLNGEDTPFTTREEVIAVKDGEPRTITMRESVHGAVVAQRGDEALALRAVGHNVEDAIIQWWEMGRARNFEEFENALRRLGIPMFTVIYADREGNIMHLYNEQVPIRREGDWAFWNNTSLINTSNPAIIPGDNVENIWDFTYHSYDELPRVVNPESGWVQNANETPDTATLPPPLDRADYPPYMLAPAFVFPRPQTSLRLLSSDDSITFEELEQYKNSTFSELTNAVLDDLIAAARDEKYADNDLLQRSADVLEAWDRHTDADSVGAALFTAWALAYPARLGFGVFDVQWDINDPLNTPRGLSDPDAAVEALIEVATQLEAARLIGGGIDVPYGDAFRMRVGDYDLPASGGFDVVGTFRTLTFAQDSDLRFKAVAGESYIALVEFSDPIRAKVLLTYGNSTQPGSPHVGDQLEVFAANEFRDAWRTREDIEANLEDRWVLNP
jgi:acyl-homoserine-lactone acylase